MQNELGCIHIYCGNGKGKTTAALGLSVRCAGRGNKVLIVQFLKSSQTGELASLALIPYITVMRAKEAKVFTCRMNEAQLLEVTKEHNRTLEEVIALCEQGGVNMLVLDEAVGAYAKNLLDRERLLDFLDNKPKNLEVVLTGRNPDEALLSRADYVSQIEKIKHPYDKGIRARIGVER